MGRMTEKGFYGSPGPVMRQKAKGTRPLRNKERMMARRHVLRGYPIEARPFTLDEIKDYFSGDRITCLLCGKSFRGLGMHLPQMHSVTGDEYRKMYGLPWRRGLSCEDSRDLKSQISTSLGHGERLKESEFSHLWRKKANEAARKQRRQPFMTEVSMKNRAKIEKMPEKDYGRAEFLNIISSIKSGCTLGEALNLNGSPGQSWFSQYKRENPEAKRLYEETVDSLPYAQQARMESLGPRFWEEVRRLRGEGLSDHGIARETEVSAMAVNRGRRTRGIR